LNPEFNTVLFHFRSGIWPTCCKRCWSSTRESRHEVWSWGYAHTVCI